VFHVLIGLAIVANSISIGIETNQRADLSRSFDDFADPFMEPWHTINMTFLTIFTLEVGKKVRPMTHLEGWRKASSCVGRLSAMWCRDPWNSLFGPHGRNE
jgi:hypothetical protein